jgi:hypothetical protein
MSPEVDDGSDKQSRGERTAALRHDEGFGDELIGHRADERAGAKGHDEAEASSGRPAA